MVATAVLAVSLIAALRASMAPEPRVSRVSGCLQAAELIHAARLCWSMEGGCTGAGMSAIVSALLSYNESLRLMLRPFTYAISSSITAGRGLYAVAYTVWAEQPYEVRFEAEWRCGEVGRYVKVVRGVEVVFTRYRLHYEHRYSAPMWGTITIYPGLWDPRGLADLAYLGSGDWLVGVPAGGYRLEDEYGIEVVVGGA